MLYQQRQEIDNQLGIARAKLISALYDRGMQLGDEVQVPELNYGVQLRIQLQQRINRKRLTEGLALYGVPRFVIDDATDTTKSSVYAQRRVLDRGIKPPLKQATAVATLNLASQQTNNKERKRLGRP